jgi:hypothetical protein
VMTMGTSCSSCREPGAADPSRRAIPMKKTSPPPFESRSLTVLLYSPSTYEAAVVSLLLAADATGAD